MSYIDVCYLSWSQKNQKMNPFNLREVDFAWKTKVLVLQYLYNYVIIGKRCGTSWSDHITSDSINTADSLGSLASWCPHIPWTSPIYVH